MSDKPKSTPEFFVYYGKSSMALNREVLDKLTEEDVAHLSEAERKFFEYCRENKGFNIHSGSCSGPRPSQEEECEAMLHLAGIEDRIKKGDPTIWGEVKLC